MTVINPERFKEHDEWVQKLAEHVGKKVSYRTIAKSYTPFEHGVLVAARDGVAMFAILATATQETSTETYLWYEVTILIGD